MQAGDVRGSHVLPLDPRIHCALVCGAQSCPPIRLIQPRNLERALNLACQSFVNSETTVDKTNNSVQTSKIFMWYAKDFGETDRDVLLWLSSHLKDNGDTTPKADLDAMLSAEGDINLTFKEYIWTSNKKTKTNP